jgi:hypothetical protein
MGREEAAVWLVVIGTERRPGRQLRPCLFTLRVVVIVSDLL